MEYRVARHGDVEIAYGERGPRKRANAPTVLLIMGIQMRQAHWGEHFLDALAEDYRVISFDNRGTGHSTKPVEQITAPLWAGDALAVLDAVGCERAHVLGFSMGGRIAQELAVHQAERVDRMLLLSSAVGGPGAVQPDPRASQSLFPMPGMDEVEARRQALASLAGPGFATRHPERLEELVRLGGAKRTPLSVLQKQIAVIAPHVVERLGDVPHPTLIVHGDADPLVPIGNGEELQRRMPRARFERLPGVGHLPQWECPERLLELAREFFE